MKLDGLGIQICLAVLLIIISKCGFELDTALKLSRNGLPVFLSRTLHP